jgi:hypothetical protein
MIYFDKKTLSVLKYIKRKKDNGATWGELRKKFGDDITNISLLETLDSELYTVTKDENGKWVNLNDIDGYRHYNFRSFSTPKANQLIEQTCFDFWKWTIPTVISIVALVVSALTA